MPECSAPAYFTENHAIAMTLRDYFAAKAMQAWMTRRPISGSDAKVMAEIAYYAADAMLEARGK